MATSPNGLEEIKAFYGDPWPLVQDDGTVSAEWEYRMVPVRLPEPLPLAWNPAKMARSVRVHQNIRYRTQDVLDAVYREGLWPELRTYGGGYTWRLQRGSHKLSMHAYGGALDFRVATNQLGTMGDMPTAIIKIFEDMGWTWGGRWGRPDPMHFQWAGGY